MLKLQFDWYTNRTFENRTQSNSNPSLITSGIPGSLLQSSAHLKPFLWNFFVYEKHMRYTPGLSCLSFQFLTPVLHKSWVRKLNVSLGLIDFFWWVQFRLIFWLYQTQSMNWVWLSLIEFDCIWLKFTLRSIGFNLLCRVCFMTLAPQQFSFNVVLLWCETKFINYINLLSKHQWNIRIFPFTKKSYLRRA